MAVHGSTYVRNGNFQKGLENLTPCISHLLRMEEAYISERIRQGQTVLDAGCGDGRLTLPLAAMVGGSGHIYAVDNEPGILTQARKRLGFLPNVTFHYGDLLSTAFADSSFDAAVIGFCTIGNFREKEPLLFELERIVKQGGKIMGTAYAAEAAPHQLEQYQKSIESEGKILVMQDAIEIPAIDFRSERYTKESLHAALGREARVECISPIGLGYEIEVKK